VTPLYAVKPQALSRLTILSTTWATLPRAPLTSFCVVLLLFGDTKAIFVPVAATAESLLDHAVEEDTADVLLTEVVL
jgi:hypothetical protein